MGALLLGGEGAKARLAVIGGVVLARTLLQDRIASLNGKSVEHVLRQDRPAFVLLIGLSVLQVRNQIYPQAACSPCGAVAAIAPLAVAHLVDASMQSVWEAAGAMCMSHHLNFVLIRRATVPPRVTASLPLCQLLLPDSPYNGSSN